MDGPPQAATPSLAGQPAWPKPVIYACSGCSDAGELADRTARVLTKEGLGTMSCLAGIGGRVKSLLTKADQAEAILVIDGCPLNCARKTLELAGYTSFHHLELQCLGLRKGSCPVTSANVATAVHGATLLLEHGTAAV